MWVMPIAYDQFGNAARLTHLGWAEAGSLESLPTPDDWKQTLLDLASRGRTTNESLLERRQRAQRTLDSVVDLLEGPWSGLSVVERQG